MTECADRSRDEQLASAFIVDTCRLLEKSFSVPFDHMHDLIATSGSGSKAYNICCGSAVEFYIRPLNHCIGDTDVLFVRADELAFSGESVVLPIDPSGLSDTIKCYEIEPCQRCPGFVRLRVMGNMNFNWRYKKYEFTRRPTAAANAYMFENRNVIENFSSHYTRARNALPNVRSGPSITLQEERAPGVFVQRDLVYSVWCPQWPKAAEGWLKRPRNNGWPTTDTIAEVVQNGCHVVYVQHRSCRDDEQQWRFSFSMAEVILLQSWTRIQQIVYHLLRFFAKRELIQKDCRKEDEVLCPYHIKTLMLWSCEEMSPEWWNTSSVIKICCELFQKLSEWLKKGYYPNYFIPEANLFYEPSQTTIIDNTKRRLNEYRDYVILCHWFEENYIRVFFQRHNMQMTGNMELMQHLENIMLFLFEFWKTNKAETLDILVFTTFRSSHRQCRKTIQQGRSSGLRQVFTAVCRAICLRLIKDSIMSDVPTIKNVSCLTYYNIVLHILHAAYGIGCGEISWHSGLSVEIVNAISMQPKNVKSVHHRFPTAITFSETDHSSRLQFIRAQAILVNLTGSNSRSEFKLVSILSKEFLRKSIEYGEFEFNGIARAALAYLASLHFAESEYQEAIRLCLAVLEYHSAQEENETLNAGCLLFIDDIARIIGLRVLHKKITSSKLNLRSIGNRIYTDLRLSPEVFAHYISVISHQKADRQLNFYHDVPQSAFSMDEYLKTLLIPQFAVSRMVNNFNAFQHIPHRRVDIFKEIRTTSANDFFVNERVNEVLMEYALENMTTFYNEIRQDFAFQCNTADCYRALYLYKCHKYDEVLTLCEQILHESDLPSNLMKFSFANVLLFPPIDSFFDRDVQSLLGLHTLFYYLSPLNGDMGKTEISAESTFEQCFAHFVCRYECELMFLLEYETTKRSYFLGRHFLARYLKVRCCIDCNRPYIEAISDLAAQKINLPFEHIIRSFLLRKRRFI